MGNHLHASTAAILIGLGLGASPAMAETWQTLNQARKSALVVECTQSGSVTLTIQNPARSGWQANVPVSARVGGQSFTLEIEGGSDYVVLSDTNALGISPALMAALQGGGSFVLDGPAVRGASAAGRTYPLTGAKLAGVAQACGMRAAAQPDILLASPSGQGGTPIVQAAAPRLPGVAEARKELEDSCTGKITYKPGFQRSADFNGDGVADYVIDWSQATCSGRGPNIFCGSSGCTLDVFVSGPGGHKQGYSDTVRGWSIGQGSGSAVLILENRRMAWTGSRFTPAR